jgi:uncharacterized protein YndB with AHSA1/START domain
MEKINSTELNITRVFEAPVEKVWNAWADPSSVRGWWGPKGFSAPFARADFRVGGSYLYCMRGPDGRDYWSTGVYKEIEPLEKIVCTDSFADKDGNVVPASYYGMQGDFPMELLVTLTFESAPGGTKLNLRHAGMPAGEQAELAKQGWNESLDKLAEMLSPAAARRY